MTTTCTRTAAEGRKTASRPSRRGGSAGFCGATDTSGRPAVSKARPLQVPAKSGPLTRLSRAELRMLDNGQASVDSMNETEAGGKHASDATLNAGQAAADAFKALWRQR